MFQIIYEKTHALNRGDPLTFNEHVVEKVVYRDLEDWCNRAVNYHLVGYGGYQNCKHQNG